MCFLNPFFVRYFYFKTVLHLIAVSYERYKAIVKSPLTYHGTVTKFSVVSMALIWIPIPFLIGPFVGWGNYIYNPEVFFCEQGWSAQGGSIATNIVVLALFSFVLSFLVIVFLNWRVFKVVGILQRNRIAPVGSLAGSESQLQVISGRMRERKAAVDVSIILAAFLLCFLPSWFTGLCRQFVKSPKVPAEVILSTTCIFFVSSLCNPIIYSIRKKRF